MPLNVRPDIGSQIRKARLAAGLTQIQAAVLLDVAERTYQSWEASTRTPRIGGLTRLAAVFEQPVCFFYGDDDPDHAEAAA